MKQQVEHAITLRDAYWSIRLLTGVLLWGITVIIVTSLDVLPQMPRPMIPMCIIGPVVLAALLWRRTPGLRGWSERVSLRVLAAPHVLRIAFGSAFLYQVELGTLPELFGQPAGTGDLIAGVGALCLIVFDVKHRRAWLVWNIFGLCDMLMVITLAQYHIFGGFFDEMKLMFTSPYVFAPFMVVPIVLATHMLIMRHVLRASE